MSPKITFCFGGMNITLEDPGGFWSVPVKYVPFLTDADPDMVVHVHRERLTDWEIGNLAFSSPDTIWRAYRRDGKLSISGGIDGTNPTRVLIWDTSRNSCDLYIFPSERYRLGYPLDYPFEELLVVNLLAQQKGVLLHACAVEFEDKAFVFAGHSGAGKSTMANLWHSVPGATILSDDRVIVRKGDDHFLAYGTPWHGDVRALSPRSATIQSIFVLHHGSENHVSPSTVAQSASRLFVRSFPPFGDAQGIAFTLGFLGDLCGSVPCYDLGVVPDNRIVDFVLQLST